MDRDRRCVRPTCGEPATCTMTYNHAERVVWLDDLGPPVPGGHDLCLTHGDTVKPMVGWALDDRRSSIVPFNRAIAS